MMADHKFLTLLRGINVGGGNIIKMVELRSCLTSAGLKCVKTYIQSGNIVFESNQTDIAFLEELIHNAIKSDFNLSLKLMVFTKDFVDEVVANAPSAFGSKPDDYKYDVMFLNPALNPQETLAQIPVRDGIDQAIAGPGVIYFTRLSSELTKSHLYKITSMAVYQEMTIRNWRTTTRLHNMLNE